MNSPGSSIAEFNFDRREHFFVPYSSFHHADDRYMYVTYYIHNFIVTLFTFITQHIFNSFIHSQKATIDNQQYQHHHEVYYTKI